MKNISDETASISLSGLAGVSGAFGASKLFEYISNKSAMVEKLISEKSNISSEIYEIAEKTAHEIVGSGDFYLGLLGLTASAVSIASAIYFGTKWERW